MDYNKKMEELELMFDVCSNSNDPSDIVLVCRNVLEKSITVIFEYKGIRKPVNATLLELINNPDIISFFNNDVIIDQLHFVRIVGINAFHGRHIKRTQAKVAYDNTKQLLEILNQKLIGKAPEKIVPTTIVTPVKSTVVSTNISEIVTRKIYIDTYLEEAGWEVVEPKEHTTLSSGKKVTSGAVVPAKACCEIPVKGLHNVSGIGFCDYVLYGKDGKPLAIVEAKKASVDPIKGQQQVREYGKCMEAVYGYVPVLYYTNGYEINVMDGKYPPRKVNSFHTLDELTYMIQKRDVKKIKDMTVKSDIAGRPYQKMAIQSMCERFNSMQRRGLLVMATGTGKTRTAIALVELLTRNNFIKNVLFLADRTSLVSQAFTNFQKLLPNMTYSVLSDKALANDENARITFSTHQTMINYIDKEEKKFTIGRFDLIIIDEAHRSIFNKFRAIIEYFDSLVIGLTATPKDEVDYNTYKIFNCESGEPNYSYSMEEAVKDKYLVPYKLVARKTKLLSEGILFKDLSSSDKDEITKLFDNYLLEDDLVISNNLLFKKVFNKDTCRKVLDDLMSIGLRVEQGQQLGKTIIFAVNHNHAKLIVDTFNEMYPQYPEYCKLIDNQVKNADHLIKEFEDDPKFRIAVSVDMLDTGIDVPAVLNLVFFKKVNSSIKLIQMIGRGTRLCEGLIDGKDKTRFYILDYFENLKDGVPEIPKQPVSMTQKLFSIRLNMMCMMQTSEHQMNPDHEPYYVELRDMLMKQIKGLREKGSKERVSVRAVMSTLDKYCNDLKWQYIYDIEEKEINMYLVPLLVSDIKEDAMILGFDYLMLKIEKILIEKGNVSEAVKLIMKVRLIAKKLLNMASVHEIKKKIKELNELYQGDILINPTIQSLEYYRKSVRHLAPYLREPGKPPAYIDIEDETMQGEAVDNPVFDIRTYKEKVLDYLLENSENPTIQKIKNLEPLKEDDFKYLEDILWVKLGNKEDYYSISKIDNLAVFIRSIVGIDQEAINKSFSEFLDENDLTSEQQEFIYSIINYVRENGDIEPKDLIDESPFDGFDLMDLFGNEVPIVRKVVDTFHECIQVN